jgi:SNF2 family DNA or RNA helicase
MTSENISGQLDQLLTWSKPRIVPTRSGPRMLCCASPTEAFWTVWDRAKQELKQHGISVTSEDNGKWMVNWWRAVPAEFVPKDVATIEASSATDSEMEIPCPPGLSFMGFQRAGIAFVSNRYTSGKEGALIADEPGLGKTIQGVGTINVIESISRILIICPNSLKVNWSRELSKWLTRKMSIGIATSQCFPSSDVVIIHFQILNKWVDKLSFYWDLVILDEAHNCKNPNAQRSQVVMGRKAHKRKGITPKQWHPVPTQAWP